MRLRASASSMTGLLFAALCVPFGACQGHHETAGLRIEFTRVPRAGEGSPYKVLPIEGLAIGSRAGQQIVLYARAGAWWVQPLADQPYTGIQPDSTWKSTTHPGTEYAALLVDAGYRPPVYHRFASRGEADYQDKLLSAMRYGFGGHLEKAAAK